MGKQDSKGFTSIPCLKLVILSGIMLTGLCVLFPALSGKVKAQNYDFGDAPFTAYPTLSVTEGGLIWAREAGGGSSEASYGIAEDSAGNTYITGYYYSSAVFGETNQTSLSGSADEIFVAKYNSDDMFAWAKSAGGPNDDYGFGIAVDISGNSYVTGSYYGSAVFGAGEVNETHLSGSGNEIFVAKYNSDGTLAWAADAGDSYDDYGHGIAVDNSGNVYVAGSYYESVVFGAGEVNETTLAGSGNEIFVAKYNNNGTLVWAKDAGGSNYDYGYGIAVDSSGNIYITGSYYNSAVFGAGETNEVTLSGTAEEIFVAKYSSDGTLSWAKDAGGLNDDNAYGITVDSSGNVYITGDYYSSAVFGTGEPNETHLSGSSNEILVAKYNSDGTLAWAKDAGGSNNDHGYGIALDSSRNVYITGSYYNSATFGAGEVNETYLSGSGNEIFVAKYNNDGTLAWATEAGGNYDDSGYGIALDSSENIYVTGFFDSQAVFGSGEINEITLYGSIDEIFVAKYSNETVNVKHALSSSIYLGDCVDSETNGLSTVNADGDDNYWGTSTYGSCAVGGDDEDGVIFGSIYQGNNLSVDVKAYGTGNLSAWTDWNADGDWDDTGEQIFSDESLVSGTNNLIVNVPANSILGDTFARFRFSSDTGLSYNGAATDGEMEDYKLTILEDTTYPAVTFTEDVEATGAEWGNLGTAGFSAGVSQYNSMVIYGGAPYVAFADSGHGNKATVMKFDGTNWVNVGTPGFSAGSVHYVSLAMDGNTPYVAYQDVPNNWEATVMKFDGTNWVNVGAPGFSASYVDYVSLALDGGTPYVAYQDQGSGDKATVMKFDGSNWVNVGNTGFSADRADYISLALDGSTPYVAYQDYGNSQMATVKKFDGANWVNVGTPGFSSGNAEYTSLAVDGNTPYVAFKDSSNWATVMKYDGANWVNVGTSNFSAGQVDYTSLALDGSTPYVAYKDINNSGKATVMKFDGSNWVNVGSPGFTAGAANFISLALDGSTPYVTFEDYANIQKATVMRYVMNPVSSDDITITVSDTNPDSSTHEYGFSSDSTCDGTDTYGNVFISGTQFTINTETNNGKWICAKASDLVGNTTYLASAYTLNVDATGPVITFTDEVEAGPVSSDQVTITATDANPETMTYRYGLSTDSTCDGTDTYDNILTPGTTQFTINTEDNNGKWICAKAADLLGNISYQGSANDLNIDITYPVITITDDVEAGPVASDDLIISVADINEDTTTYEYGFSPDSTCDGTDTYGNVFTSAIPFTINTETNNGKWVCVKAADLAGNTSYEVSINSLNVDATAPSVAFTDDVEAGLVQSDDITITVTGADADTSTFKYGFSADSICDGT